MNYDDITEAHQDRAEHYRRETLELIGRAEAEGVVVTIEQRSGAPLAQGNYSAHVETRINPRWLVK